ncbi:hypothetical protein JT359_08285 [Candidatus Poribacteria bacterium]|nr:hypothetical protein [Candidatus Poribacteria bacterium]
MKRLFPNSVFLFCIILLNVSISVSALTLSGKVIDEEGNAVPEITIGLEVFERELPIRQNQLVQGIAAGPLLSKTDSTGKFSIQEIETNIPYQFKLTTQHESDYEIKEIEIDSISIYMDPHQSIRNRGFPFVIDKNIDVENVKIVIKPRMYIRGQVVLPDGTPLRNESMNLRVKVRTPGGSGSSGGTYTLDAEGFFKRYVNEPAIYTIEINYQGQTVKTEEIRIDEGQRIDGITIKLKENPKTQPVKINAAKIRPAVNRVEAFERRRNGVWVINPINRHAYRKIYCQNYEEAINKANTLGAHLLTINDKEEQQWIVDVFGKYNYWIGLTKSEKNLNKKWDNGEPITYTNWNTMKHTNVDKSKMETVDTKLTALIGFTGKWLQLRQDSPIERLVQSAILEKEHLVIGISLPNESN